MKQRKRQLARILSGGEQQILSIGRALISRSKLLMLDEPPSGLMPMLIPKIFKLLEDLRAQGITILLVEQNTKITLEKGDRTYVIENGRIFLEGNGKRLFNKEKIKQAYLGF